MSETDPQTPWPQFETADSDGRRQRSDRSRRRIIEALFELLREGDMSPSANKVAEKAGVGLRTVFRHFEDMDSIHSEMAEELTELVRPRVNAPLHGETWQERMLESIDRNAEIYEIVFPMKVGLSLRRFQSDFLQQLYERDLQTLRRLLRQNLPQEVIDDPVLLAALETTLSFSMWRRLRQDQHLSIDAAKDTVRRILSGLMTGSDED